MARSTAVRSAKGKVTFWGVVRAVSRLIIPVFALLGVYAAAYELSDQPITAFDVFPDDKWFLNPGYWLTAGHFVIPLAWLVSNLTNRRYGEGYALAQLIVAWLLLGLAGYVALQMMEGGLPTSPLPSKRVCLAFLFAIFLGQIVGIYVFDRTRGRTWWGAPLFASLWGQSAFVVAFYSLSYLGMSDPWTNFMLMDLAIKVSASFLMLIPYAALRGLVRPLPGYGGA